MKKIEITLNGVYIILETTYSRYKTPRKVTIKEITGTTYLVHYNDTGATVRLLKSDFESSFEIIEQLDSEASITELEKDIDSIKLHNTTRGGWNNNYTHKDPEHINLLGK